MDYKVDDIVEKIKPKGDYTVGRIGRVVEVDEAKGRVRVRWSKYKSTFNGEIRKMVPLRTWVAAGNVTFSTETLD